MKRIAIRVALLIGLALPGVVLAQVNIDGPRTVRMRSGEVRTVEYTITNRGEDPVEARVFYNDYAQQSDGLLQHIPAASLPQSLFRVAGFEQLEYVLAPGSSARVPLVIRVPEEPAGSYWGVIGVETPPPPAAPGENAVSFNIRYAMVSTLEIEGVIEHDLTLDNLAHAAGPGKGAVILTIRNSGNGYQRFQVAVTLEGADGSSVTLDENGVVLPGLTIDYALPLPGELSPGQYGVFAEISYAGGLSAEAVGAITVDERPAGEREGQQPEDERGAGQSEESPAGESEWRPADE